MDTHFLGFLHLVPNASVPERKNEAEIQHLKQQLADIRRDKDAHVQQLEQELAGVRLQNDADIQQLQQQLADVRKEKDAHILQLQQQMADVRKDKAALNHQIELLIGDLKFHEVQILRFQQCLSELRRENEHLQEVSNTLTRKICRYNLSIEMHLHKLLYCTFLASFPGSTQLSIAGSMEKGHLQLLD